MSDTESTTSFSSTLASTSNVASTSRPSYPAPPSILGWPYASTFDLPGSFHERSFYQVSCLRGTEWDRQTAVREEVARPAYPDYPPSRARSLPILPREIRPGELKDGSFTTNHPIVLAYLERLEHRLFTGRVEQMLDVRIGAATGEGACVEEIPGLLGIELDMLECRCFFTLAALSVCNDRHAPTYAAFWYELNRKYTDKVVHEVYRRHDLPRIYWEKRYLGLYHDAVLHMQRERASGGSFPKPKDGAKTRSQDQTAPKPHRPKDSAEAQARREQRKRASAEREAARPPLGVATRSGKRPPKTAPTPTPEATATPELVEGPVAGPSHIAAPEPPPPTEPTLPEIEPGRRRATHPARQTRPRAASTVVAATRAAQTTQRRPANKRAYSKSNSVDTAVTAVSESGSEETLVIEVEEVDDKAALIKVVEEEELAAAKAKAAKKGKAKTAVPRTKKEAAPKTKKAAAPRTKKEAAPRTKKTAASKVVEEPIVELPRVNSKRKREDENEPEVAQVEEEEAVEGRRPKRARKATQKTSPPDNVVSTFETASRLTRKAR